jgi:hypothetical protein
MHESSPVVLSLYKAAGKRQATTEEVFSPLEAGDVWQASRSSPPKHIILLYFVVNYLSRQRAYK